MVVVQVAEETLDMEVKATADELNRQLSHLTPGEQARVEKELRALAERIKNHPLD